MSISGKRVLVTGASGFIGSHLVEALVSSGASVKAIVHYNATRDVGNLVHASAEALGEVDIQFADIRDCDHMASLVEGADVVFHLAALIAIPFSYIAPRSYVATNVEGTLNMLEAVRRGSAGRLVHTSTSEVYGSARYVPIDEMHPLQGQSPYSATKIAADKLVESYVKTFEIDAVTVRPFNTYGPRQSARAFIPTVIVQALRGGPVRLGSVTPIRDLTYVSDTVDGFIAAADSQAVRGETLNLGVGEGWSVGEVASRIINSIDSGMKIEQDQARVRPTGSEVDRLVSSNSRMRERTGWTPRIALDTGLQRTIAFFREHSPVDAERYIV
jgi:NAD dependent epimerase/dehydratase